MASSRFTFTRLVNGHSYSLFVRAHNRVGFSQWVRAVARPHAASRPTPPSQPAHHPGPPAPPAAPRDYPNCAALNRVYPHGVGRPGSVDHTSDEPVTNFTRSLAVYRLNTESDRDHDGIACEQL